MQISGRTGRIERQKLRPLRPVKLALVSCGLGRVSRGFEVSTSRWLEVLTGEPDLDIRLYCGGNYPRGTRVWSIGRDDLINSPLNIFRLLSQQRYWEFCYGVEQVSFALSFLKELLIWRPDVVWTKDVPLAHLLTCFKQWLSLKYKVIFANGGAFKPRTYKDFDFIQHLHPDSLQEAVEFGISETKMALIPNCVLYKSPKEPRAVLRDRYGYGPDQWIITCVAAWNCYQKRLDYLINEVATLKDEQVMLLLCGHPETETDSLKKLAAEKLGTRVRWLTLPPDQVQNVLHMSDVFVLPSLREGLASSIIEAAMAGIPVLSHPHAGGRFILKDACWLQDMNQTGGLAKRLAEFRHAKDLSEPLRRLKLHVFETFDGQSLAQEFSDMVKRVYAMA